MPHRRRRQVPPSRRPEYRVVAFLLLLVAIAIGLGVWMRRSPSAVPASPADVAGRTFSSRRSNETSQYVGAQVCADCHAPQAERWRSSMHARAMELPTVETVKAPFAGESFTLHGVTSSFSRVAKRFVVRTDSPDGTVQDFDVAYTFGVE